MNADAESIEGAPVIARRSLQVTLPDGTVEGLEVRLASPVSFEGGEYRCYWGFRAPGYELVRFAAGADAFQAIQLAMRMIGASLSYFGREKGYRITWGDLDDSGFPDFNGSS